MTKKKLFEEDSEEEVSLKTENEYAKKYDVWREKEELYKLEQKYGSKALKSDASESSDSEDEADEPPEVSEEVEKQFLKTLALLKTKDPRIYDPSYKFYDEKVVKEKEKEPETKKMTFGDSEDDDDDDGNIFSIEKKAEVDQPSDLKTSNEKPNKKDDLKAYLTGKADHVEEEEELAPLRALWSDPKLNQGEAFLRDYILNKRYLEQGPVDADQLRDDEELEEDEKRVEEQGQFERAYNFRFEEPDQEFLKRFPRTMNHIRPKDDSRSRKRAEMRERKEKEKQKKMEEIARMKSFRLKELKEKIAKIKEVTGNEELAFREEDIEGDFDPEEHDTRMKALFDEQYYGDADDKKPVFPEMDEELEIENWDKYEKEQYADNEPVEETHCEDEDFNMDADYDPKKAKENLLEELTRTMGKKRRNRKKKTKLAQLLEHEKPKFVPEIDKTYSEFMEEYYKMDCEDIIGDLPTRFKYRQVVPNSFGLTVEEILLADDKELTQWVPLKKIVKYRPENAEKSDVNTYSQKATDVRLKKKILPSLFIDLPEEPEITVPLEETNKKKKKKKNKRKEKDTENEEDNNITTTDDVTDVNESIETNSNTKEQDKNNKDEYRQKKKKKKQQQIEESQPILNNLINQNTGNENDESVKNINKSKKKKKRQNSIVNNIDVEVTNNGNISKVDNTTRSIKLNSPAETVPIKKSSHSVDRDSLPKQHNSPIDNTINIIKATDIKHTKGNKRKKKQKSFVTDTAKEMPSRSNEQHKNKVNLKRKLETQSLQVPAKKKKNKAKKNKDSNNSNQKKQNDSSNPLSKLSDERLKAYGLNPKKYRSFLKYKKF